MTALTTLQVKHTVSYKHEPLACIRNLPGLDAELSPIQLRQLAAALIDAASDCEALQQQTRDYGPVRRQYPLGA